MAGKHKSKCERVRWIYRRVWKVVIECFNLFSQNQYRSLLEVIFNIRSEERLGIVCFIGEFKRASGKRKKEEDAEGRIMKGMRE